MSSRPGDASDKRGHAPVQLSLEEVKVLKECRVNSVYYRGLPTGLASILVARFALKSGYFPRLARWSGFFYSGMFSLGLVSGIASYRDECFKKIMALENSVLAEQFRNFQKKAGLPVTYPSNSEFERTVDEAGFSGSSSASPKENDYDSPLMDRMQQQKSQQPLSKWEQLRQESRQSNTAPYNSPSRTGGGITYDDLRKKNRAVQNDTNNTTATNDSTYKPPVDIDSFQSQTFSSTDRKSVLDFSRDDEPQTSTYSTDYSSPLATATDERKHDINTRPRKTFAEATGRKNMYGDDME